MHLVHGPLECATSVHAVNGAWGCLALGLFADGTYGSGWNGVPGAVTGLFYGDPSQFVAEFIGVVANLIITGLLACLVFKLSTLVTKMRVEPSIEGCGLDIPEMGTLGYIGESIPECPFTPNKDVEVRA